MGIVQKKFSIGQAILLLLLMVFAVVCVVMTANGTMPDFLM